jgi:fructose-1,6-bisphosphatase I
MKNRPIALNAYLVGQSERESFGASGLDTLILHMATAARKIGREIQRAALTGRLGLVGGTNPTGDAQKKLDVYSNEVVVDVFEASGLVAGIVSEEMEDLRTVPCNAEAAYLLCVDPLDGSSNTDVDSPVGTIFSFYRRSQRDACRDCVAELRHGAELAAAGYVLYGPSTLLVYTLGHDVNAFTLDQEAGEFLLSHEGIRCPESGPYYSVNLGRYNDWDPNVRRFADHLIEHDPVTGRPYSLRYTGALVADLHRILLQGGIYFYPPDRSHPDGKLRLLYECAPLALVAEAAGARASTGRERVLDVQIESLHQRVPFAVGGRREVELYESFVRQGGPQGPGRP